MAVWLMKTEPGCFSIHDLAALPGRTTPWDGVRNYQARNFMRDAMAIGEPVLFYHSVTRPGIVGLAEIASGPYPDPTQFDPAHKGFDPRATPEKPRWVAVDVRLVRIFDHAVTLPMLRDRPELENMVLLQRGSRLSIQPVRPAEYDIVLALAAAA